MKTVEKHRNALPRVVWQGEKDRLVLLHDPDALANHRRAVNGQFFYDCPFYLARPVVEHAADLAAMGERVWMPVVYEPTNPLLFLVRAISSVVPICLGCADAGYLADTSGAMRSCPACERGDQLEEAKPRISTWSARVP